EPIVIEHPFENDLGAGRRVAREGIEPGAIRFDWEADRSLRRINIAVPQTAPRQHTTKLAFRPDRPARPAAAGSLAHRIVDTLRP
ncbi:MAG: hypothetical protein VX815_01430, partial [Gemmatimonadota bacterium]|nr:hypothetical protein [Gemmatimonadota bacterium]